MKLRLATPLLLALSTSMASAIDLYSVLQLQDHGRGSRGRHIQSWNPELAAAVGDLVRADGIRSAAIWPTITQTDPGPLIELPTENPTGPSTAASYGRLADGRYLVVGQDTGPTNMRRAAAWLNSTGMPWNYLEIVLPTGAGSTGSEALDVAALPNGGAAITGTDWFVVDGRPTWLAALWLVSPTGQATERMLPVPPGTGWATPQSVVFQSQTQPHADGLLIVGRIQESPGGPWRACMWRGNLQTNDISFAYIDRNGDETYGYRTQKFDHYGNYNFAIGWTEMGGQDFGTLWQLRQGYPDTVLPQQSRLYGANSRGYLSGWFVEEGVLEGLVAHVSLLGQGPIAFANLVGGLDLWERGFHLLCVSEHGFNTGCGTSSDYPGGASVMHAHAGAPTGDHGADEIIVRRGASLMSAGEIDTWFRDDRSLGVRAQNGLITLDFSVLSLPIGFGPLNIDASLDADIVFHEYGHGVVSAFNYQTGMWDDTGMSFEFNELNEDFTFSWATFPSSWRSASGEVKLRLNLTTPNRRNMVYFDCLITSWE